MLRGRQQNVLVLHVDGEDEPFIEMIMRHFEIDPKAANGEFLTETAKNFGWLSGVHRLSTAS